LVTHCTWRRTGNLLAAGGEPGEPKLGEKMAVVLAGVCWVSCLLIMEEFYLGV